MSDLSMLNANKLILTQLSVSVRVRARELFHHFGWNSVEFCHSVDETETVHDISAVAAILRSQFDFFFGAVSFYSNRIKSNEFQSQMVSNYSANDSLGSKSWECEFSSHMFKPKHIGSRYESSRYIYFIGGTHINHWMRSRKAKRIVWSLGVVFKITPNHKIEFYRNLRTQTFFLDFCCCPFFLLLCSSLLVVFSSFAQEKQQLTYKLCIVYLRISFLLNLAATNTNSG